MLNNLSRIAVKADKTVRIVLDMYPSDPQGNKPVLVCASLTQVNTAWLNKVYRGDGNTPEAHIGRAKATSTASVEQADINRLSNRKEVIEFSCKSFEFIYDDAPDGSPDYARPMPVTAANIAEVIGSLPPEVFDGVLAIVANVENFRDATITGSPSDVAKK